MLDKKKIARWVKESQARWSGYCAAAEMMRRAQEGSTTSFAQDAIDRLERDQATQVLASLNSADGDCRFLLCGIMTREGYNPRHIPFKQFHDTFQKLMRYLHENGFLAVFVSDGPNATREGMENWLFYASWRDSDEILARPFDASDERD